MEKIYKVLYGKEFIGKPAGLWVVIFILCSWSILKLSDIYFLIRGEIGIMTALSLVIVPVNLICLKGIFTYNKRIFEFTGFWLWMTYVVSVFILPQYIHYDERPETFLLMAILMSPLLVGWLILKSSEIRKLYEKDEQVS